MIIRYLVNFTDPIVIEDHWPIPIMGGECRIITANNMETGMEITFSAQPVHMSPEVDENPLAITSRDRLLPLVEERMRQAFSFIQCYFDVEISFKEIEIEYIGETEEEEGAIKLKGLHHGIDKRPLRLKYDFFTRAIMAAEKERAPEFEATLVSAARRAMISEKYIDSFRYSFLLIEALYGGGKFKTAQLKATLKVDREFSNLVSLAMPRRLEPKAKRNSQTEKLLASEPSVDQIIDHLVDMRGFYFHGNKKRKDAWQPHDQEEAEALCLLALSITTEISHDAAAPMFDDALSRRHFEDAKNAGALMTLKVNYTFRDPGDNFDRQQELHISIPGTKVTPRMAVDVAKNALEQFEERAPISDLKCARCTVKDTGQEIFELRINVEAHSSEEGGNV